MGESLPSQEAFRSKEIYVLWLCVLASIFLIDFGILLCMFILRPHFPSWPHPHPRAALSAFLLPSSLSRFLVASIQPLGLLVQNQVSRWCLGCPYWALHPHRGNANPSTSHWKGCPGLGLPVSQGAYLHKPHVQRAVDFLASFPGCMCVCTCVCARMWTKRTSFPRELEPGPSPCLVPLPLLSLHKRPIPGDLCPLSHPEPCWPIYHSLCSIYAAQRYLLCLLVWLCFFSLFSHFVCHFIYLEQRKASKHDLTTPPQAEASQVLSTHFC